MLNTLTEKQQPLPPQEVEETLQVATDLSERIKVLVLFDKVFDTRIVHFFKEISSTVFLFEPIVMSVQNLEKRTLQEVIDVLKVEFVVCTVTGIAPLNVMAFTLPIEVREDWLIPTYLSKRPYYIYDSVDFEQVTSIAYAINWLRLVNNFSVQTLARKIFCNPKDFTRAETQLGGPAIIYIADEEYLFAYDVLGTNIPQNSPFILNCRKLGMSPTFGSITFIKLLYKFLGHELVEKDS